MADDFEYDEEKALKQAFRDSIEREKLFNLDSWKKKRENQRVLLEAKLKKIAGF